MHSTTSTAIPSKPRMRITSAFWWLSASCIIAALALLPVLALLSEAIKGSSGLWQHLTDTVLATALPETLILLLGVGLLAGILGTTSAWLVSAYRFPGRRLLEWALLLPLAMPTYIIAYAYLDILHPLGPVQGAVRFLLGYSSPREFRLPDIRSMTGCILLLGFVLYPYVYIPVRAMFLTQAGNLLDAARMLGTSRHALFLKVAVPLARPAIAVGVSLALMEALNDIGASEFLGVRTLTVSIYTTWITKSDLPGASQIALFMLLLVVALVAVERWARRSQRYSTSAQKSAVLAPLQLQGLCGWLAFGLGTVPILIGFVAPATYLVVEAWKRFQFSGLSSRFAGEAVNTIVFAGIATVVTVGAGLVVAYAMRLSPGKVSLWSFRLATVGYAAPGTVIAIGVLIVLGGFDRFVDQTMQQWFGISTGLLLIGSGSALIFAYVTRFLTIAGGGIDAGLSRIPLSFDQASRTLGRTATATFRSVHLPLSKAAMAAAALLVFVDCVKELPATLLLRPLNFETFATHLYGEAARGTYEEASIAALAIVLIGILPVVLLARVGRVRT
ncbi:putative 2-aminoethylphosphonate transport system permease protein PhnU [Agrobacterium rosae]|uniref:Putative 2-aminoethylphosphonate transport system permease protein PhnU n=2 Tax=Agrobacterium rosae TaxID=1972867 RepID=A0A1R3TKL3_9HYPH|nr:putative 2-aminoethylphosphonate transport system permease protein PhnU [Agrobacterium rosae]